MITSAQNPKIRLVRALSGRTSERKKNQAFLADGIRLTEEALQSGWKPSILLFSENLNPRGRALVESFSAQGVEAEEISQALMKSISDTETPQGVLAVFPLQPRALPEKLDFILICDGIRDPGNMGTILRAAVAAGCQAVITTPGTTDVFAPKVVRSGMGAHFRLPIHAMEWDEIQALSVRQNIQLYVTDVNQGAPYWGLNLREPVGIIIGSEASGACPQAYACSSGKAHIPMPGNSESLNAGIAASIFLFEIVRQRYS